MLWINMNNLLDSKTSSSVVSIEDLVTKLPMKKRRLTEVEIQEIYEMQSDINSIL